jgi:hypothetical protein
MLSGNYMMNMKRREKLWDRKGSLSSTNKLNIIMICLPRKQING